MATKISAFNYAAAAAAATFSMSAWAEVPKQAICALQQSVSCPAFEACERALPGAVNLPSLLRVEIDNEVVESRLDNGEIRTSKIERSTTRGDVAFLQGEEEGHPWTMRINTKSGRFTLTVAREDEGIVGFGVCSASILK